MTALDQAYLEKRQRLTQAVSQRATAVFQSQARQAEKMRQIIPLVEAGQAHAANLVAAYMATKASIATGGRVTANLNPASYTIGLLRGGILPGDVYSRPFAAVQAALNNGLDAQQAVVSGTAALTKLVATDLQLAQTHAARDWLTEAAASLRIVGYRRVLTGPGPHCNLCTLASTRTYHTADLMAIHEHCGCTVEPLWGTEPVPSVGTTVRVEDDPEIGPRLMADSWSPVGPTL